jgi:hypothetical protein
MLIAGITAAAMLLPTLYRDRDTGGKSLLMLLLLIVVAIFGGAVVGVLVFTVLR